MTPTTKANAIRKLNEARRILSSVCNTLDGSTVPCESCGRAHYRTPEDAKVLERISELPGRLKFLAKQLEDESQPAPETAEQVR